MPVNPPGDLDDIPEASKAIRPSLWNHMKMDERGIREARRGYYASTSFMDDQLGLVMQGLEKMGLATAFSFDQHFRQFGTVIVVP